jgi:hypothetical protein
MELEDQVMMWDMVVIMVEERMGIITAIIMGRIILLPMGI